MHTEVLAHHRTQTLGARSTPIALQLARESEHRDRRRAPLDHALDPRFARSLADAADRIGDEVHLVAFVDRIERRKRDADFGPEAGEDELLPPGLRDGRAEIGV